MMKCIQRSLGLVSSLLKRCLSDGFISDSLLVVPVATSGSHSNEEYSGNASNDNEADGSGAKAFVVLFGLHTQDPIEHVNVAVLSLRRTTDDLC